MTKIKSWFKAGKSGTNLACNNNNQNHLSLFTLTAIVKAPPQICNKEVYSIFKKKKRRTKKQTDPLSVKVIYEKKKVYNRRKKRKV